MSTKPIRFVKAGELAGMRLAHDFMPVAAAIGQEATRRMGDAAQSSAGPGPMLRAAHDGLVLMDKLEQDATGDAPIDLPDAPDLVASVLAALAELEGWSSRLALDALVDPLQQLSIGTATWAVRHAVTIERPEGVVNALATLANRAADRDALAAAFGLMESLLDHLAPQLASDLEQSNPERPWRILTLNLALTAIRTEDIVLIKRAFDKLDANLPGERRAFYESLSALAADPKIPDETRKIVESRLAKHSSRH